MDQTFIDRFQELAGGLGLTVILFLLMANLITGVLAAILSKTFTLKDSANILRSRVVPMVAGYLTIVAVAVIYEDWQPAIAVTSGLVWTSLTGAILANLKEMGFPIPSQLSNLADKISLKK
jgi:phage-related holin